MSRLLDRPWCKSFKEKSELYISWVEDAWVQKQDLRR
jgi:hypothetical protein